MAGGFKSDPGYRQWAKSKGINLDVEGGDPAHSYNKYTEEMRGMSNEDLMAAIRHEKEHITVSGETRGPRQHAAYLEAHVYPRLIPLEQERNRRMKERREAQSGTVDRMVDQGTIHPMFQPPQEQGGE